MVEVIVNETEALYELQNAIYRLERACDSLAEVWRTTHTGYVERSAQSAQNAIEKELKSLRGLWVVLFHAHGEEG